jgi:hypothetical protein
VPDTSAPDQVQEQHGQQQQQLLWPPEADSSVRP